MSQPLLSQRRPPLSGALVLGLSVVVALLTGGVLTPRPAHAAQGVGSNPVLAATASTTFDSTDRTGCIFTEATIVARTSSQGMSFELSLTQFDQCLGTLIISAGGATPFFHFEASPSVCDAQAEGQGVAIFDDVTRKTFSANVEVEWRGIGPVAQSGQSFTRSAVATGQFTIDHTNFTPHQSTFGEIQEVQSPGHHVPATCD